MCSIHVTASKKKHNGKEKQAQLQGLYAIKKINNNTKSYMVLVASKEKHGCKKLAQTEPTSKENIKVQTENILGLVFFSRVAAAVAFLFVKKKHTTRGREKKENEKRNEAHKSAC
jgi:Holliday junction resolvase